MIGFKSLVHQGWFHAKYGGQKVPPQFVKSGRKVRGTDAAEKPRDEHFQTSVYGEFMQGVKLFHEGKPWNKETTQ